MKNINIAVGIGVVAIGVFVFMNYRKTGNILGRASNVSTGTGNADTSSETTAVEGTEEEILAQCQVLADEKNLRRRMRNTFVSKCTAEGIVSVPEAV